MVDNNNGQQPDSPRLLVADDEWNVVELLVSFLGEKGYQVSPAYDGREALDLFNNQPFDLVLSDLRMPTIGGLQLLEEMKRTKPQVPVVLISGYGDIETVVKALKAGAENFLSKPLRMDALEWVIKQSLAISSVRPDAARVRGDIHQTTHIETPSRVAYIPDIVYQIASSAVAVGFCQHDLDSNVKLALVEALTNAIEHGNQRQRGKMVKVDASLTSGTLKVTIADEGPGFDHKNQADPTSEENLLSERGRGIFLMRSIMDDVHYNEAGNAVTLLKHRPAGGRQVN
jgi:FixJ family two-component response regulator